MTAGVLGGRERRALMGCPVILVMKVDMEKEVPRVFLDSEVTTAAQVRGDPREQEDFQERRVTWVTKVRTGCTANRVIVESRGYLEKKGIRETRVWQDHQDNLGSVAILGSGETLGILELIVISKALRENKEDEGTRDVPVLMDLGGKLEVPALRGQEEDKACPG